MTGVNYSGSVDDLTERRYREMMRSPVTVAGKSYPSAAEAHMAYSKTFAPGSDQYRKFNDDAWAALRQDARNSVLLDEYNRQSEANRPKDGDQKAYDALVEQGRAKYAGGAFERVLTGRSAVKQDIPKAEPVYEGPSRTETPRTSASPKPRKQDDWDRIVNAPTGVMVDMMGNRVTTTVGAGLRDTTDEEWKSATRQDADGGETLPTQEPVEELPSLFDDPPPTTSDDPFPKAWNDEDDAHVSALMYEAMLPSSLINPVDAIGSDGWDRMVLSDIEHGGADALAAFNFRWDAVMSPAQKAKMLSDVAFDREMTTLVESAVKNVKPLVNPDEYAESVRMKRARR